MSLAQERLRPRTLVPTPGPRASERVPPVCGRARRGNMATARLSLVTLTKSCPGHEGHQYSNGGRLVQQQMFSDRNSQIVINCLHGVVRQSSTRGVQSPASVTSVSTAHTSSKNKNWGWGGDPNEGVGPVSLSPNLCTMLPTFVLRLYHSYTDTTLKLVLLF